MSPQDWVNVVRLIRLAQCGWVIEKELYGSFRARKQLPDGGAYEHQQATPIELYRAIERWELERDFAEAERIEEESKRGGSR